MPHPAESTHWYKRTGEPAYTVVGKNGIERPTTLRDAQKDNLIPSVTTIMQETARPGLQNWIIDQAILSCLTMPLKEGESEGDYIPRLKADSKEQARRAAEKGTQIHAWVQTGFIGEEIAPEGVRYYESALKCLLDACGAVKWHCEKSFATHRYGGKVDLYSDGIVVDIKTTEKDLATIKTWDNHSMQLAAYEVGLGDDRKKCGILYIHVLTAESKIIWLDEKEIDRGWAMFEALTDFWYSKTGL